jgi:hypothetical protein
MKTTKTTLKRRHFLAGSLTLGTAMVAGCGGGANQTLYTVQAVVGIIVTLQQLTRRGVVAIGVEETGNESAFGSLAPKATVAQTATGLPQAVHIVAEGVELHLSGGDKALQIGHSYAIAPMEVAGNKALPGGTFTLISVQGNSVRFRVENAQVQDGTAVVPVTWETTAPLH